MHDRNSVIFPGAGTEPQQDKKTFSEKRIYPAIPSGIDRGKIMAVTLIARYSLQATSRQVDAIATLTALLAGFIVVFNISGKMNKWKWALLVFILAVSAGALLLFPALFDMVPLTSPMIRLIVICGAAFLLIHTVLFRVILPGMEHKK